MLNLYLLRHAKSSWKDGGLDDIDRPLNKRGKAACKIMAPIVTEHHYDKIFCSPAVRARETIRRIAKHSQTKDIKWEVAPALYTFNSEDLFAWCRQLNAQLKSVLIVGHNPAITDFCNQLTNTEIDNVPTGGFVSLLMAVEHWSAIDKNTAELSQFYKPKDFD